MGTDVPCERGTPAPESERSDAATSTAAADLDLGTVDVLGGPAGLAKLDELDRLGLSQDSM